MHRIIMTSKKQFKEKSNAERDQIFTGCPFNGWQGWSLEDRIANTQAPSNSLSVPFMLKERELAGGHWAPVKERKPILPCVTRLSGRDSVCHGSAYKHTQHLGVASLCQHSLPSATEVDASSRSPLEINKREMLYTLMTFPQWLSNTKAAIKLLCRGWDCPQPSGGRGILNPLYTLYQQPAGRTWVIIRSLCGMGPTEDSLGNAATPTPSR